MAIDNSEPLLGGNKWINALSLLGATLQDVGGSLNGRPGNALLGAMRLQEQQRQQAQQQSQKSAQAALLGGLDPTTGITWNTPRQGMDTDQQKALFMQAFPEVGAKAAAARLFPAPLDPKDRYQVVGDTMLDISGSAPKPVYQAPSPWMFPGAAGGAPMGGGQGGGTGGTTTQFQPPPEAPAPMSFAPDLDMKIGMAEEKYGLPSGSLRSLVQTESGGRQGVTSPKGATGLAQLMPGTARDLGVNPADPDQNLDGGARYLKQQLDRFGGNLEHAYVAYNWGPGNADLWVKSGADPARLPKETRDYLARNLGGGAPVQVAQANTGIMSDAAPAGPSPAAGQWVRGIDRKTGKQLDIEQNTATGAIRPVGSDGLFSGSSVEGQALNALVASGVLTREQAATWAAGKTATGPNGQLDFVTPQGMRGGQPPAGGAPAAPALAPIRQGQMSGQDKDAIMEADKAAEAAAGAINSLKAARDLNRKAFEGSKAAWMPFVDRNLLPGEWGGAATTEFENIMGTQALSQLRTIFGGNPTEGERKIMLDLQGSITLSADERERLIDRAIDAAQNRLQREQGRARALRGGTYYTEGLPQPAAQPDQQGGGRVLRFDAQGNLIQ